ncbi:2-methoxy-6-polyprenyl-1,4-benzoquinol methylase, mitochondrial isoform X2 [Cimex lectularius]|nr:2-methoxy-6-polyprenyl-1,4-benzoquinol methylase, mitochondrial isoform X2 [Cimex lectularius]
MMNDAMSFGVHRLWKDCFVERLGPTCGTKLLDVAGGTGDIAFRFLQYLKNQSETGHATVLDANEEMLRVGEGRAERLGLSKDLTWTYGDAEKLPFPDSSFDAYTIAFGIRNVTHIDAALREAYRVLRPGGRFLCLEFSRVTNPILSRIYDSYSFQMIPAMGQVIAGDWKSYQYLVESIRQFPDQERFKAMIRDAGFYDAKYENMTFGVVAIHSGFKL